MSAAFAPASIHVQQDFNQRTRERWSEYASHRARVNRLIADCISSSDEPAARSLCVLGAGNCNDLDFTQLVDTFGAIALLDIDTDAVSAGLERQGVAGSGKIDVIKADLLAGVPALPRYDIVLSSCVLSQLIGEGVRQAASPEALLGIRRKHLVEATELTNSTGTLLLVTDFVADTTVPDLMQLPDYRLADLAQRLAKQANFFHGLNPFAVEALLTSDPAFCGGVLDGRRRLWRWNMGQVVYFVAAWRWRRRQT
jgi:hypothetical protein